MSSWRQIGFGLADPDYQRLSIHFESVVVGDNN